MSIEPLRSCAPQAKVGGSEKGGFLKGGFGGCSWTPKNSTRVQKTKQQYQKLERGYDKNGTTVPKTGTRAHSPKPPFSVVDKKVVFSRMVLADFPPERKPERGYIRMFPRNEGTFAFSPGTKTRTRVHSPKPPFYETALLSPSDLLQNRPLVSSRQGYSAKSKRTAKRRQPRLHVKGRKAS